MKNVSLGRWFCGRNFYAWPSEYKASPFGFDLQYVDSSAGFLAELLYIYTKNAVLSHSVYSATVP